MKRTTRFTLIHKKTKTKVLCSGVSIDETSWKTAWEWKKVKCVKCLAMRGMK